MLKWTQQDTLCLLLIALMAAFALHLYPQLPDQSPVHWGADGEPDGYSDPATAAWMLPGIALVFWLLLFLIGGFIPALERNQWKRYQSIWVLPRLRLLMLGFLFLVYLVSTGASVYPQLSIHGRFGVLVGVMIFGIGTLLRAVPEPNPDEFKHEGETDEAYAERLFGRYRLDRVLAGWFMQVGAVVTLVGIWFSVLSIVLLVVGVFSASIYYMIYGYRRNLMEL